MLLGPNLQPTITTGCCPACCPACVQLWSSAAGLAAGSPVPTLPHATAAPSATAPPSRQAGLDAAGVERQRQLRERQQWAAGSWGSVGNGAEQREAGRACGPLPGPNLRPTSTRPPARPHPTYITGQQDTRCGQVAAGDGLWLRARRLLARQHAGRVERVTELQERAHTHTHRELGAAA